MEVGLSRRSRSPLFRGLGGLEAGEALDECLAVLVDGVLGQPVDMGVSYTLRRNFRGRMGKRTHSRGLSTGRSPCKYRTGCSWPWRSGGGWSANDNTGGPEC